MPERAWGFNSPLAHVIPGELPGRGPGGPERATRSSHFRAAGSPDAVDRASIAADYKDGVLLLHLPKRDERQGRRLKIDVK